MRDKTLSPQSLLPALVRSIDAHPDLPLCAGCGRCCHLVVELQPGDCVPAEFVVTREGARCLDQRDNGACIALDPVSFLCTIYERRPQTCRDFQRGGVRCRTTLAKPAIAEDIQPE